MKISALRHLPAPKYLSIGHKLVFALVKIGTMHDTDAERSGDIEDELYDTDTSIPNASRCIIELIKD